MAREINAPPSQWQGSGLAQSDNGGPLQDLISRLDEDDLDRAIRIAELLSGRDPQRLGDLSEQEKRVLAQQMMAQQQAGRSASSLFIAGLFGAAVGAGLVYMLDRSGVETEFMSSAQSRSSS